jgi:hypothetical protein
MFCRFVPCIWVGSLGNSFDRCHCHCICPQEHKISSTMYLVNRLNTYQISKEAKEKELNIIKHTLHNNYNIYKIMKHPDPQKQKQNINTDPQYWKPKCSTFTYSGKETRKITQLFKDTKIKITFRTWNKIQNILRQHPQKGKYNDSSIYQMNCLDCPFKYIGQTGRTFDTRYKDYIQASKNNNSTSGYSNDIWNTGHKYGTINENHRNSQKR